MDATNGAPGLTTNGARGRYDVGLKWQVTWGASTQQPVAVHITVPGQMKKNHRLQRPSCKPSGQTADLNLCIGLFMSLHSFGAMASNSAPSIMCSGSHESHLGRCSSVASRLAWRSFKLVPDPGSTLDTLLTLLPVPKLGREQGCQNQRCHLHGLKPYPAGEQVSVTFSKNYL